MKEMIVNAVTENGEEVEKTIHYRSMTRPEVKRLRKLYEDNKDLKGDQEADFVLKMVLSDSDFNIVENEAYHLVYETLFREIIKETFGVKEEEKN